MPLPEHTAGQPSGEWLGQGTRRCPRRTLGIAFPAEDGSPWAQAKSAVCGRKPHKGQNQGQDKRPSWKTKQNKTQALKKRVTAEERLRIEDPGWRFSSLSAGAKPQNHCFMWLVFPSSDCFLGFFFSPIFTYHVFPKVKCPKKPPLHVIMVFYRYDLFAW